MAFIHATMVVAGIVTFLFGYMAGDLQKDGVTGLLQFLMLKFGCLLGGGFFIWYGLYQLGWRLVS